MIQVRRTLFRKLKARFFCPRTHCLSGRKILLPMITLVVAGVVVACAMVTEAMIAATKQGSLPCSLRAP